MNKLTEAYFSVYENVLNEANRGDEYAASKEHPTFSREIKQKRRNASFDSGATHGKAPRMTRGQETEIENMPNGGKSEVNRQKTLMRQRYTNNMRGVKVTKEQADLYDIILSHLLDEGYAETPEAAEVIMVNMSEDWRDSIVEDVLDEAVLGARKGTIRSVIEKGGKSIKYVQSGGDIVTGDRAAAERASAADRKRSGKNRANTARAEQARKKSIQNLNAKSGEDSGDYDSGYYGDDDTSDGKRHYSLSHTNRVGRNRRAKG